MARPEKYFDLPLRPNYKNVYIGNKASCFVDKQTLSEMDHAKKKQKITSNKAVVFTDDQMKEKHKASKNINTTKTEEQADRAFKKFLTQCGESNLDYWYYKEPELDNYLAKF